MTMPDPAPPTAEERRDMAAAVAYANQLVQDKTIQRLMETLVWGNTRLLAALDAAEARLADAQREALEEARQAVEDAVTGACCHGIPCKAHMAAVEAIRALAAPHPTEETTP